LSLRTGPWQIHIDPQTETDELLDRNETIWTSFLEQVLFDLFVCLKAFLAYDESQGAN
jgi:hypothetical protein